jgi:hypothetical protein
MTRKEQQAEAPLEESGDDTRPAQASGVRGIFASQDRLGVDPVSDGDGGERPVREKLKKTSIGAIPRYDLASSGQGDWEEADMVSDIPSSDQAEKREPLAKETETRGRPSRKRSLEDLDVAEADAQSADSGTPSSTHLRKRSRDVRAGGVVRSVERVISPSPPIQDEAEGAKRTAAQAVADEDHCPAAAGASTPPINDREMHDSVLSPKKKRSREEFESDSTREQKIVATEENRRRRSSEEQREEEVRNNQAGLDSDDRTPENGHVVPPKEVSEKDEAEKSTLKVRRLHTISRYGTGMMLRTSQLPAASGFGNTSSISPFGALAGSNPPSENLAAFTKDSGSDPPQTSSEAFKSSGFAALANSPSAFGTFGGSNGGASSNPPLKSFASPFGPPGTQNGAQGPLAGSTFGKATTSAFGSSSGFGTLGGSGLGSGFGSSGGFGSGTKLTAFAAPIGGKLLGGAKSKPFGAPEESDEEGSEGSENGEEDGEEQPDQKEAEGSQANGYFQLQTEGRSTANVSKLAHD